LHHNPLVPVAAIFLGGVALGHYLDAPVAPLLILIAACLVAWLLAEILLTASHQLLVTHFALGLAILFSGICVYRLNQHAIEPTHIARYLSSRPVPITARLRILAPPENPNSHGNSYAIASLTAIFSNTGWTPAVGDVRIKSKIAPQTPELRRNQIFEIYGWLQRPTPALNPGGYDERRLLAADRIFAEIRIPRTVGMQLLTDSSTAPNPLTRFRTFLRGKLIAHTTDLDPEAGYSMLALLLGRHDPAITNVSDSFADAGVSHLLAISGLHVLFFTTLIWTILRFFPMQPRRRELVTAAVMLAYVLATPCGPPVLRAAIALLMLLLSRLLNRPRHYLNMLAAAAILIVLIRPTDLFNAGFQLTFLSTTALVLFAEPLHQFLFGQWLAHREATANLTSSRFSHFRFRITKTFLGLLSANIIGATSAAPLVAFHFMRLNPHAGITGIIAFPFVALAMTASAIQLLFELVSATLAALASPITTFCAQLMLRIVEFLAALPLATIAVRPPPAWIVAVLYLPLLMLALNNQSRDRQVATGTVSELPHGRSLTVAAPSSRFIFINSALAALVITAAWYTFSQPVGSLHLTALSAGQGSSILLHTPSNQLFLINAGSRDDPALLRHALIPAMQQAGRQSFDAMILTSFDALSSQYAAEAIHRYRPPLILTSPTEWQHLGWTRAGADVDQAITTLHLQQQSLTTGTAIDLGQNATLRILWPLPNTPPSTHAPLIFLLEHQGRRILLLDPTIAFPLALMQQPLTCDTILFLGPRPGTLSLPLQKLINASHAQSLIYSGRTPWAPPHVPANELNTADGALTLTITSTGSLTITPAEPGTSNAH